MELGNLSDEQQKIAKKKGLVVVTACPGAGKTRLVATRLAMLAEDMTMKPYQGVAIISFTHTAVKEIKAEYKRLVGARLTAPHFVGTIDSFLTHFVFLPFGNLVLGKPNDKPIIVDPDSPFMNVVYKGRSFKGLQGFNLHNYRYKADGSIIPEGNKADLIIKMKEHMKAHNLATISDTSFWSLTVLRKFPLVTRSLCKRFPYIMIDEGQDTSDVQMTIIDLLKASGHFEIMLLGDPYQAIYEFRHAEPALLVQKTKAPDWSWHSLNVTFRCKQEIALALNKCHCIDLDRCITSNKAGDGTILFLDGENTQAIIKQFRNAATAEGLRLSRQYLAILYGAHDSIMSRRCIKEDQISSYFKSKQRERHACFTLALRDLEFGENDKALRRVMRLLFLLKNRKLPRSKDDLENDELFNIKKRCVVWNFIKTLPNSSIALQSWVDQLNRNLPDLGTQLGITFDFVVSLNQRKKNEYNKPVMEIFYPGGICSAAHDITITNIHQVKGRTFDGVLIYLEEGNDKKFAEGKLLKLIKGGNKFNGLVEDHRCLYVAMSRAKQLLCFAGSINRVKEFWAKEIQSESNNDLLLFPR